MKVKVNEEACIGCGACTAYSEAVFELNDDGISVVKTDEVPEDEVQNVKDAIDSCPTAASKKIIIKPLNLV